MSKTGGGRGTNQHQVRGSSKAGESNRSDGSVRMRVRPSPEVESGRADGPLFDLPLLSSSNAPKRTPKRSVARFREHMAHAVLSDALLEGNHTFTAPEIQTLIEGSDRQGINFEESQVIDLVESVQLVSKISLLGTVNPTPELSRRVNAIITRNEVIEPGLFRGEGQVRGGGNVTTGIGRYRAIQPDERTLAGFYKDECDRRFSRVEDPTVRAAMYASWASYHQFHSNGNKRTARHLMNAMLMSRGYDAVVIPASMEREYQERLTVLFSEHDGTPYSQMLLRLMGQDH